MPSSPDRCLVIGHDIVLLDGLRQLLEPEFELWTTSPDVEAALTAAAALQPDVAVIDLDAGDTGVVIARRLCEAHPGLAIAYLTTEIDPRWCPTALYKGRPASELLQIVRAGVRFANGARNQPPQQSGPRPAAIISGREREVLALLVQGLTMKQVARKLGITPRTVAFHKYRAMEANGLRDNADLMAFALRHGLRPLPTAS